MSHRLSSTWSIQSGEGWLDVFPNLQKGANLFSLKGGHGRRLPLDAVHHTFDDAINDAIDDTADPIVTARSSLPPFLL
jgi:hypothetical protein